MNDLEKKDYYNSLYQYYGALLTDKQKEMFECYYIDDFSLSEIAENLSVSRNAVWDTLKKVIDKLEEYEVKLKLYNNDILLDKKLNELLGKKVTFVSETRGHELEDKINIVKDILKDKKLGMACNRTTIPSLHINYSDM